MSVAEYIEATNRTKLRIAYNVLKDIVGGHGPISSEWLTETLIQLREVLDQADGRVLVD